jgi:hypothetical protein
MTAFQQRRGATLATLALTAAIGIGAVSACSGSGTPAPTTPTSTSTSGGPQSDSPPAPTESAASTVRLAAVGDMNNDCNTSPTSATGEVASSILAAGPELVFGLGDFQYPKGTCSALVEDYDKVWGKVVPLMYHIAGPNHDWNSTRDEEGYRRHFAGTCPGQTTGPSALVRSEHAPVGPGDFWSRDVGAWHLVGLSTGLWRFDQGKAEEMTRTLDRDLAAAKARGKYLLVAYHDPYFTSTTDQHGPDKAVKPWVDVIDKYDVRLTLSASQHNYERSCPILESDACTPDTGPGTTAFNVSTGGVNLRSFVNRPPYIVKRFSDTYGWLALSLHPDGSFDWRYHPVVGSSTDSGTRPAPRT